MRNFIKIDNIKKFKSCLLSVDYQNLIQKYYFNNEKASIRDVQKILHKYEIQLL